MILETTQCYEKNSTFAADSAQAPLRSRLRQPGGNASLQISNENGQILKTIQIDQKGNSSISIDGYQLKPGQYFYTLLIDGKTIDTKKMTIIGN